MHASLCSVSMGCLSSPSWGFSLFPDSSFLGEESESPSMLACTSQSPKTEQHIFASLFFEMGAKALPHRLIKKKLPFVAFIFSSTVLTTYNLHFFLSAI
jgi:hypothetical protein